MHKFPCGFICLMSSLYTKFQVKWNLRSFNSNVLSLLFVSKTKTPKRKSEIKSFFSSAVSNGYFYFTECPSLLRILSRNQNDEFSTKLKLDRWIQKYLLIKHFNGSITTTFLFATWISNCCTVLEPPPPVYICIYQSNIIVKGFHKILGIK